MHLPRYPLSFRIVLKLFSFFQCKALIPVYIYLSDMFLILADRMAIKQNGGSHPKIAIMDYAGYFTRNITAEDSVLDIGSSYGELTFNLAAKAKKVTGIEINPESHNIAKIKRSAPNITYVCGDVTKLELLEKFNVVVMSNVLEHIENRIDILKVVNVLSPKLLLRIPCIDRDWWTIYRKNIGMEWRMDETHYTEYTYESINSEISQAGWKINSFERRWGELYLNCTRAN